ncbi:FAD-dependent oxidoreductase [Enterovirga rhinocerotis]|uniref:3-(3-hydroxy-phenyl)propionate hydroxylase n=1 Tax=Enterovirga rhinocerotis TaxID=1339210 RepID=A0A4V3DXS4_9HYPH|nr:FAD-dependent oxidoreductase [Enterovirga rhinocerotis]TDR89839.1 3-(3-hydroxy-phenyl)propionate hydroxylase [Enterovirga rhinocerotis]
MASRAPGEPDYQRLAFRYEPMAGRGERRPVIVVGAGPVGLAAAIDLARQGVPVLLIDDDDKLSQGSRAICFAKRTLEIFDRLGCGQRMVEKGVTWNRGKVFVRDEEVYAFDLLPEGGHRRPAFVNLQQYYVEGFLLDCALALPAIDIRWRHRLTGISQDENGVTIEVETPEGTQSLACDWLIAADGARSATRKALGLVSSGRTFRDRFLIADVRMEADFPAERWFWFDPPFHPNRSVLLHQQPDQVWRVDFQLGWEADPIEEQKPEKVMPRLRALLGEAAEFELEWVSVYTFSCLRLDRFRHGRVLFAGDSAHGVSPFGARGANSGIQDAENLAWKLGLVVKGLAPETLLDSYDAERVEAADENILASTRSTDFITPKSEASRDFRDAALDLARDCPFARRLVNSGRLSVPSTYRTSPLTTADRDAFAGPLEPGAPVPDAPIRIGGREGWFLDEVGGAFTLIVFAGQGALPDTDALRPDPLPLDRIVVTPPGQDGDPPLHARAVEDREGLLARRFDAAPGTVYLLRPDQHVCARWRSFDAAAVAAALQRAAGGEIGRC